MHADGPRILEVNLSCNLFNGPFDSDGYYELLYQHLAELAALEAAAAQALPAKKRR